MTSLQVINFYQLVHAAMKIEKSEMKSQERKSKRKFKEVVHLPVKELESLRYKVLL